MALLTGTQRGFSSHSTLPLLDLAWILEATAAQENQKREATRNLLRTEDIRFGNTAVETSLPAILEDRCNAQNDNGAHDLTSIDSNSGEEDLSPAIEKGSSAGSNESVPAHSDVKASSSSNASDNECDSNLEISEMRKVFQKFDENQDGLICSDDLRHFMRRLGFEMSEEEAVSMLGTVDHNGDGKVVFQEFCTLYQSFVEGTNSCTEDELQTADEEETILEAFRVFDKNDDGFITSKELQTVLLDMGMSEGKSLKSCELMIQRVDADGNGVIDITEFKQMMSTDFFQT